MSHRGRLACSFIVLAGICATTSLAGSTYLEQSVTSSGMMGQPPSTALQKLWLTDDKLRVEDGAARTVTIIRRDTKKAYMISNAEKSYAELSLEQLGAMAEMGLSMLKQMGQGGEPKVQVTKTGETAKVGEWNTYVVLVNISGPMTSQMKLWLSRDIQLDMRAWGEMAKYMGLDKGVMGQAMEQMTALEGYPVKNETTAEMMGMKFSTTTELKLVKHGPIEPTLFDPPADYKRTEGLPGMPAMP